MDILFAGRICSYWYDSYGRMGNRPIEEIRRAAQPSVVPFHLREHNGQRYALNRANTALGYVAGERAAWLASINARVPAETDFAWKVELVLARAFQQLDALHNNLSADTQKAQALTFEPH